MVTTEDILTAYYDCRRNKRTTAAAIVYEMDYESKVEELRDRINSRTYQPSKSICFVVLRPRRREVFAAAFEDRIIHHYIAERLEPLFEEAFSPKTFNCRKGKGQLYGIGQLKKDIRTCSENFTKDCYVMKLDIQSFFMSINKKMLAEMIDDFIVEHYEGKDKSDLRYLSKLVIMHEPQKNCEKHSPAEFWEPLPYNKSLFTNKEGHGIAIGNLFAQLFANFLLNVLDWYLIHGLSFSYVGRYVDDFYIVSKSRKRLSNAVPKIREMLARYGLTLHPKKFYLQHYSKGVDFTGGIIKFGRVYTKNRNVYNFIRSVKALNRAHTLRDTEKAIQSVNSYLGLLHHCAEYGLRRKVLNMVEKHVFKYVAIKGHFDYLVIKAKYRKRHIIIKHIRNGTLWRKSRNHHNKRNERGANSNVIHPFLDND